MWCVRSSCTYWCRARSALPDFELTQPARSRCWRQAACRCFALQNIRVEQDRPLLQPNGSVCPLVEKWSLLISSSTRWTLPHGELPEFRVPVPSKRQLALPRLRGAAQTHEAAHVGPMIGQGAGQPDDGSAPRLHVRAAACGRCERRSWTCPPPGWSSCCRRR